MPTKQQKAASVALDDTATILDGGDALVNLALLVRAIDRRNLWHEIAWEPDAAALDARRAVARVRRALEVARDRAGE